MIRLGSDKNSKFRGGPVKKITLYYGSHRRIFAQREKVNIAHTYEKLLTWLSYFFICSDFITSQANFSSSGDSFALSNVSSHGLSLLRQLLSLRKVRLSISNLSFKKLRAGIPDILLTQLHLWSRKGSVTNKRILDLENLQCWMFTFCGICGPIICSSSDSS